MKLAAPSFYKDFHCKGSHCKHNCCIGWEVDIDEDTANFYRSVPGAFGKRLRQKIKQKKNGACFRMGHANRCPFLNHKNLCDIILTLGEEGLCQICADHPRFRADFSNVTEVGLGMACEEAARLLLTQKDFFTIVVLEDDGEESTPTAQEAAFFEKRKQLFALAQYRSLPVSERIALIAQEAELDGIDLTTGNWVGFLEDLEIMEPVGYEILSRLMLEVCAGTPLSQRRGPSPFEIEAEQVLVYFLYRYLSHTEDPTDYRARVGFSLISCQVLMDLWNLDYSADPLVSQKILVEHARRYSAEVEYCEENVARILRALKREIRDRDKILCNA